MSRTTIERFMAGERFTRDDLKPYDGKTPREVIDQHNVIVALELFGACIIWGYPEAHGDRHDMPWLSWYAYAGSRREKVKDALRAAVASGCISHELIGRICSTAFRLDQEYPLTDRNMRLLRNEIADRYGVMPSFEEFRDIVNYIASITAIDDQEYPDSLVKQWKIEWPQQKEAAE